MIYDVNGQNISTEVDDARIAEGMIASNLDNAKVKRPYWIVHLDCGRKFFSVANIKALIDLMESNGLNQLQLHFAENSGLRFGLDDMTVIDCNGNSYDLSDSLTTTGGGYLDQSDMDEIIVYARAKDVDIVPSLDMPGHMGAILTLFPQFSYPSDSRTLDVKNSNAKNFAFAIIEKYARYFKSRGCIFYNIGADEVVNGRWSNIPSGDVSYFLQFVNEASYVVSRCGLIPRVFNDGVMYNRNYTSYYNRNIQVYCWRRIDGDPNLTPAEMISNGFELINANSSYYYITPTNYGNYNSSNLDTNMLLKNLGGGITAKSQSGFMLCIWCDSDDSSHSGDGGDGVVNDMETILPALGSGITKSLATIDYPIVT